MPAVRKPTKVLEANGAFKRNPKRARPQEPEVKTPIGNAPDYFDLDQATAWKQIVFEAPEQVLTGADRIALEMTAVLLAEFRSSPADFATGKYGRLQMLLGHFGMTPAERSKLGVDKKPKENEFAGFFS